MRNIHKVISTLCLTLGGLCLAQPIQASPKHNWGTHGYFRLQTGFSEGDSRQEIFKAPGAGAKYRLGNENDNYVELDLYDTYELNGDADGPFIHTEGMVNLSGDQNERIDFGEVTQLWVEAGNLTKVLGNPRVWVGRRYYDRHDIHINDFFFLNTLQGADGGGIRDIDLGIGKLAVAFGRDSADAVSSGANITQTNFDVRLSDIAVNSNGKLMLWALYSRSGDKKEVESTDGWALGVMHTQTSFFGGYNKFMVQYGTGLARNAGTSGVDGFLGKVTSSAMANDLEEAETWRITNQNVIEPSDRWSLMTALVYEDKESRKLDGTDQTWVSVGVRPVVYFTDYFRMPFEVGYDFVDDKAADTDGSLTKATVAAELALSRGFWTRPVLRAFATYADWSDDFKGQIGGETFAGKTDGLTAGVQIESWW